MEDHNKLKKLLDIIMLLSNGLHYTKGEMMERFDLPERTADRYISTIREAGFILPRPRDGRYWIDKKSPYFKELSELLHFSKEEAQILYNAIHSINNENLLKQNLIRKLHSLYNLPEIAKIVVKQKQSAVIHELNKAIRNKNTVLLRGYRSGNSHEQKDRRVEPFSFTTDFISTWAYDVEAGCCKTFKNTRVASVQVLNETWAHADSHREGFMDVFRISTEQQIPVRLKLSMRASELLKEEYPLSEQYIKSLDENHFLFEAPVCSFDGVGRFILGLCHEVEILEPVGLKNFLKERVEKNLFRR